MRRRFKKSQGKFDSVIEQCFSYMYYDGPVCRKKYIEELGKCINPDNWDELLVTGIFHNACGKLIDIGPDYYVVDDEY